MSVLGTSTMAYPGFEYQPVSGWFERLYRRTMREHRKTMLRFFEERGQSDLALRLRRLRDNSALNGEQKRVSFQRILDAYAARVSPRAKEIPDAETAPAIES